MNPSWRRPGFGQVPSKGAGVEWLALERQMTNLGQAIEAVARQAAEDTQRTERLLARVHALQQRLDEAGAPADSLAGPPTQPPSVPLTAARKPPAEKSEPAPGDQAARHRRAPPGRASLHDRAVSDLFRATEDQPRRP